MKNNTKRIVNNFVQIKAESFAGEFWIVNNENGYDILI